MSEESPSDSVSVVWHIIRAAALLFALTSIGLFIADRTNTKTVEAPALNDEQSSVYSAVPDPSTYQEFESATLLFVPDDAAKLPVSIDPAFINVIEGLLADNQTNELGCVSAFTLLRYSNINAQLTEEAVLADTKEFGGSCGGGVVRTYSLISGEWVETPFSGQALITCDQALEFGLFDEFSGNCLQGDEIATNPNGSILDWGR